MRKASKPKPSDTPRFPHREMRALSPAGIANPSAAAGVCIATGGEHFPKATIDLVADPSDSYKLNLLLWDGSSATVAPRIEYGRSTYEPISLEPSLVHAVQWPMRPIEYGSTRNLFGRVLDLITQHLEIREASGRLLTLFVFTTWFPDRLSMAPGLAIVGPARSAGVQALKLLRSLCRRSLLLAEPSYASLLTLPLQLSPTLLMNQPVLSRPVRSFLRSSNRRGLYTVKGGKMLDVCCPKAAYFGMDEIPQDLASVMIQVPLPSVTARVESGALHDIAAEVQGKMLAYRLANYSRVQPFRSAWHELHRSNS